MSSGAGTGTGFAVGAAKVIPWREVKAARVTTFRIDLNITVER